MSSINQKIQPSRIIEIWRGCYIAQMALSYKQMYHMDKYGQFVLGH